MVGSIEFRVQGSKFQGQVLGLGGFLEHLGSFWTFTDIILVRYGGMCHATSPVAVCFRGALVSSGFSNH